MHKSDIKEIKERYGIDLESLDFNAMSLAERMVLGQKIIELEKRLIIDNFYESLSCPAYDSMRAYRGDN